MVARVRPSLDQILQQGVMSKMLKVAPTRRTPLLLSVQKHRAIPKEASEMAYTFFTPARLKLAPPR